MDIPKNITATGETREQLAKRLIQEIVSEERERTARKRINRNRYMRHYLRGKQQR